jgi:hypothetical protein
MKIIKKYDWSRRDFCYDEQCEFCNYIRKKRSGYGDANYYNNVIPNSVCPNCGKSTRSENAPVDEITPKYSPFITI